MTTTARITITSGPDRGKVFQLNDELVHIGSSGDNQIELSDEALCKHQASIVNRSGRYAIYTPFDEAVEVDGNTIPGQRWVWLPATARISISERTTFQFSDLTGNRAAGEVESSATGPSITEPTSAAIAAPKPRPSAKEKSKRLRQRRDRSAPQHRQQGSGSVARFTTEQGDDTRVTLGADGHLPELSLNESTTRKAGETTKIASSPLPLWLILGASLCASLFLLFVDLEPSSTTAEEVATAQREIVNYYGNADDKLQPYQLSLRRAGRARSQNDRPAERRAYRRVLDLLNAEDNTTFGGVTGKGIAGDKQLRGLVTILYRR